MVLTKTAMKELMTHMSFTQLRFHCSKQRGRTFHVTTAANRSGEAVVQYFSGQTDVIPASCGSFVRMQNDNSNAAGVCKMWGWESGKNKVGKWGHTRDEERLYVYPAFVVHSNHWRLTSIGVVLCDDNKKTAKASTGDFWKVFVR